MKAIVLLGLALVFGGLAAYLVNSTVNQPVATQEQQAPAELQSVVVAASDLPPGTELQRIHLKVVELPAGVAPVNSYQSIAELLDTEAPVVMVAMSTNEAILPSRLSIGARMRGITPRIPNGYRAIAIPVNDVRGVGGFVLPGDRVDVLHTTSVGRRDERPVTRTLLQDLTVLGVDQRSSETEENPIVVRVVTLLAQPEQTKSLTLAQQVGHLTLSLRNEGDSGEDETTTIALNDLWSFDPGEVPVRAASAAQQPRHQLIQIIRGLEIDEQSVSRTSRPSRPSGTETASN